MRPIQPQPLRIRSDATGSSGPSHLFPCRNGQADSGRPLRACSQPPREGRTGIFCGPWIVSEASSTLRINSNHRNQEGSQQACGGAATLGEPHCRPKSQHRSLTCLHAHQSELLSSGWRLGPLCVDGTCTCTCIHCSGMPKIIRSCNADRSDHGCDPPPWGPWEGLVSRLGCLLGACILLATESMQNLVQLALVHVGRT